MAKRYAGALSLIAFAAVCLRGMVTGRPFATVLGYALVALFAFAVLGFVVGSLARRAVEESVNAELAQRESPAPRPAETDSE